MIESKSKSVCYDLLYQPLTARVKTMTSQDSCLSQRLPAYSLKIDRVSENSKKLRCQNSIFTPATPYLQLDQKLKVHKKLTNLNVPVSQLFYQKLDFDEILFQNTLEQVYFQIQNLIKVAKNKQKVYKVIERIINQGLGSIKYLLLEAGELVNNYKPSHLIQRLKRKSMVIYSSIMFEIKLRKSLKGMKPNKVLLLQLEMFGEKLYEMNELQREEKFEGMKNKIITEWKQVSQLLNSTKIPIVEISVDKFPHISPAQDLDFYELAYGPFELIQRSTRRQDKKLTKLVYQIKCKDQ